MEGYVYIARIIDHGGKFVNGYHKIGLSKQYKVRETQLNSTHLPFDVLMIRVFETEDMGKLEGILHVCFDDYRVIKEYDDRKNITTEWFDVSDIDTFNERLDKMVGYLGVKEIDLGDSIDNDTTMTDEEKNEVKEKVGRAKTSKLIVNYNGLSLTKKFNYETFFEFLKTVSDIVGIENLRDYETYVAKEITELPNCFQGHEDSRYIHEYNGYLFLTYGNVNGKLRKIKSIIDKFNINGFEVKVEQ